MSFLKNAIRDGLRKGVSEALGNAVKKAVEPTATKLANEAAEAIDNAVGKTQETVRQTQETTGWEAALGNLQRSMEGYATEAAKNMKVCPNCEAPATADQAFCPQCGAKLPELTVAQEAVCPGCGKQNTPGTKFCSACGIKLPSAVAQEQAQAERDAAVMADWDEKLPQYPKWNCGGKDFAIELMDGGYIMFAPNFDGEVNQAHAAVREYREILLQNGFKQAGQYPSIEHLYKKENGVCYHVDTEHCFDGDPDCPCVYFNVGEPMGGFEYVKPEPRKKASLFDLFK